MSAIDHIDWMELAANLSRLHAKHKAVDVQCFELAGHFLSGADWHNHKVRLLKLQRQLAETIQQAIEDELQNAEYEGVGL